MKKLRVQITILIIIILIIVSGISVNGNIQINNLNNDEINDTIYYDAEWYYKPQSYLELVEWYLALEEKYPNYIEVFKANELYNTGKVESGGEPYDLYYVCITNETRGLHKPEVLFLGSPHGDEVTGTICQYWFTDWLMRKAFTSEACIDYSKEWLRWLIDNREIYLEVSHNPYGFLYCREDYLGRDLNREADYGCTTPWQSVNGKTLYRFLNNHTIRVGCDFHGGTRGIFYPWSSGAHNEIYARSPISDFRYSSCPPDFFFYDISSLRVADYIGDFGGDLNPHNVGPLTDVHNEALPGCIVSWGYGSDVEKNPAEDEQVLDEIFGNYPGSGALWHTFELSFMKNTDENEYGNDTTYGWGTETRRYILHQTDLAQPYVRWQPGTTQTNTWGLEEGAEITLNWQINGSLVVDHTYVQWGTNPDIINNPEFTTSDNDFYSGDYIGGTGWESSENGSTNGVIYSETIQLNEPGSYYFIAKAQVDQVYKNVIDSEEYGENPYLRLVKERTNESYYEELNGTDGLETINGQTWWYSPVIVVSVGDNIPPEKPEKPVGEEIGIPNVNYEFNTRSSDPNNDQIYYLFDFQDGTTNDWLGPYDSNQSCTTSYAWIKHGEYNVKVKTKDINDLESEWSESLKVIIDEPVPPETPEKPKGPSLGKIKQEYTYSTKTTDHSNRDVSYMFDWGDGNFSDWSDFISSGTENSESYTWTKQGEFNVRVKAKNIHGLESNWSEPLPITMPKEKQFHRYFYQRVLHQILTTRPFLKKLLEVLITEV